MLKHAAVGRAELLLVKRFAELLSSFGYLFVDFIIVFGKLVFNQYIGTITFLGVFVVNQRIVKCINVARSFPDSWVHKDSRINAHNVFMQQDHTVPPVLLDIVL
ncbi:hypothetical protein SDC9_129680 [bioreactor metagenome]|uniref:Uncharacterized protein n=1 Tax=bioreactor metagenome TaxID=1076179 RepID=A0A645D0H6_9ZZZZ